MLTTNLPLHANRTNAGTTAIIATLSDGSTALVGESPAIGRKRAMIDILRAGNGSAIAKTLARLEKREAAIRERLDADEHDDLLAAAAELGIDLSGVRAA
jgi:hypothetical protein